MLWLAMTQALGVPSVWTRQLIGVGGWPSGLLSDTRVQLRTRGHRSDSILFRDTYYGVGGRVQLSPAFLDVGPRVSIAPIDVFDLDLQASWTGYAGPFAPLPYDSLKGTSERARSQRKGEQMPLHKLELSAAPTLKGKVGPVVAFSSTTVGWLRAHRPKDASSAYWYEPYRDLVVAWQDVTLENQTAVLVELLPGDDRPLLWIGGTFRHRRAFVSGDYQSHAGAVVMCKPGTGPWMPTLVGQGLAWVASPDRGFGVPSVNLAATWSFGGPE